MNQQKGIPEVCPKRFHLVKQIKETLLKYDVDHCSPTVYVAYSIFDRYTKDRPFRVGAGTSMKVGILQMHLFSNNIIGLLNTSYLQSVDVQFGLSWVWKEKKKKTT